MDYDLLKMVQSILSDLDFDEVDSIDDTVEAEQIASIIRDTFFAMVSNRNWLQHRKLARLTGYANPDKPTHMKVPDDIKEIISLRYGVTTVEGEERYKEFKDVKYIDPDDFLRRSNKLKASASNVKVVTDDSGVEILIQTDRFPTYYTSFDDSTVIFDSFDSSAEDTMQKTNTQCLAYVLPDWEHVGDAKIALPSEALIALLEESRSKAAVKLRQVEDVKAEQEARRQQRWLSRKQWTVNGGVKYPNYGRHRGRNR